MRDTVILRGREGARRAGRLLAENKLVVFHTETVYGLGGNATDSKAVGAIFAAKGRPADNPLIVHCADTDQLRRLIGSRPEVELLNALAPGPLTLVVPRPTEIVPDVSAGLPTIAVRIPASPLAREMIRAAGVPIAAPSANRSGRPSPTNLEMALQEMDGRVPAILDGGSCDIGLESTVARIGPDGIEVLRPGTVGRLSLEIAFERIRDRFTHRAGGTGASGGTGLSGGEGASARSEWSQFDSAQARSPGTRHLHYRPRVPVLCFEAGTSASSLVRALDEASDCPEKTSAPLLVQHASTPALATDIDTLRRDLARGRALAPTLVRRFHATEDYGRELYRVFFQAEREAYCAVVCELPEESDANAALRDRILRASVTHVRS